MNETLTNAIDRRLIFKAPLAKVWSAIGTPEGFEGWFKTTVEGEWKQGNTVTLRWKGGSMNEILLLSIDEPNLFAYQWHPGDSYLLDAFPREQLTTVTMRLSQVADGTEILLTETGFENIPDDRRLRVLGLNTEGWDEELENIRTYVEA